MKIELDLVSLTRKTVIYQVIVNLSTTLMYVNLLYIWQFLFFQT